MLRHKFVRWAILAAVILAVAGWLYNHWIGFPRHIAGRWVHPQVTWYWTGAPPLGYPFPAIVSYVYTDEHGRTIKHGPYIERGVRGNTVVVAKTGSYLDDQPEGLFTEYQTYWGTKLRETRFDHGKKIGDVWFPVPPLRSSPRDQ